jgi:hypothetical protein
MRNRHGDIIHVALLTEPVSGSTFAQTLPTRSTFAHTTKMAFEFLSSVRNCSFFFSGTVSLHDGFYCKEWIDEVGDPDRFRRDAAAFGFMAAFEIGEY